jgi:5-formyltetrahydrofolate cyclo-ligase
MVVSEDDIPLDLIVVPGVGFDHSLNRIGHGKGFYDRFIKQSYDQATRNRHLPPTLGTTSFP